jgi:hypothetical protein
MRLECFSTGTVRSKRRERVCADTCRGMERRDATGERFVLEHALGYVFDTA